MATQAHSGRQLDDEPRTTAVVSDFVLGAGASIARGASSILAPFYGGYDPYGGVPNDLADYVALRDDWAIVACDLEFTFQHRRHELLKQGTLFEIED
jgi:hypothetical protein